MTASNLSYIFFYIGAIHASNNLIKNTTMKLKNYSTLKSNWSGESVDFKANDTRLACKEYDKDMNIVHSFDANNDGSKYDVEILNYTDKDGGSFKATKFVSEEKWTVLDDDYNNYSFCFESDCPHEAVIKMIANVC